MLNIFFKICIFSFFIATAIGARIPQISAKALDVYLDDLKTDPFVRVGNKLYHIGQTKETWYMSSLICRSKDGFLASFDTQQEMTQLSDYLIANYPTDRWWWLSGSDLDTEGDFYWYRTGRRIVYADWSKYQPDNQGGNENCVHLWYQKTKYQMNDWVCNRKAYYVCEADKPKTAMVSIF